MGRLLVTGGAGFIGAHFLRFVLTNSGCSVINLDLLTYAGNLHSLGDIQYHPNYVFVKDDICNTAVVGQLLRDHQVTAVINFAAESHVDRSIDAPDEFIRTNLVGTSQLLNASLEYLKELDGEAQDRFRFLHVSTDEVYGSLGPSGKSTEESRYEPNSPYSASKAGSDHLVRAYMRTYSLPTIISNCSNNYGPHQFPEKLIPLVILNAIEGRPLPIYGDGGNVRNWLYVVDHCEALWTILNQGRPGETYNIGGGEEKTNLEVVHMICSIVDELIPTLEHRPCRSLIEFVKDRPGHDRRYAIDATKIERELGWRPKTDFPEGLRNTVYWYLEHSEWVEQVSNASYQRERLGLDSVNSAGKVPASTVSAPAYVEGSHIDGMVIKEYTEYCDERGWLIELFRNDELERGQQPEMAYLSETLPGVVRGPHEHVEQANFFAFVGVGDFRLYCWDSRPESDTYGVKVVIECGESRRCGVIVPPRVVHAYKNIGDQPAWVFNTPNRLYAGVGKSAPVDEIRHEDDPQTPYQID